MTVAFYECFDEERSAIEALWPEHIKACFFKETIQESGHAQPAGEIISIRTQSHIPQEWMQQIKAIVSRSTGYDHLLGCVQSTQTPCAYLPQYCKKAVAQQAIIMTLSLWRKIPEQSKAINMFCRDGLTGVEWENKHLLVVGVGKIGTEIVKIAKALGITVRGVDSDPREKDVEYVSLEQGLAWADAVVCAVSLNETTQQMFCLELFKMMVRRPVFVNISRGEVSPLADIEAALKQRILSGLGLDVYDGEAVLARELREGNPSARNKIEQIQKLGNAILTPHNAFNTQEAVKEKSEQACRVIFEFIKTERIPDENRVKV